MILLDFKACPKRRLAPAFFIGAMIRHGVCPDPARGRAHRQTPSRPLASVRKKPRKPWR